MPPSGGKPEEMLEGGGGVSVPVPRAEPPREAQATPSPTTHLADSLFELHQRHCNSTKSESPSFSSAGAMGTMRQPATPSRPCISVTPNFTAVCGFAAASSPSSTG